jgi:hypothetical protein
VAIAFDPATRRIVLDSTSASATEIYSRWVDWVATSDNSKYPPAFRTLGGDDLGDGLSVSPYFFLANGWFVRPMEQSQTLVITGNLFVDGGGDPVVPTLGVFNVLTKLIVPVQAQGISTGGTTAPTALQNADAVRDNLAAELLRVVELALLHGLVAGSPLVVNTTTRSAGSVSQSISEGSGTTVTRLP